MILNMIFEAKLEHSFKEGTIIREPNGAVTLAHAGLEHSSNAAAATSDFTGNEHFLFI